MVEAVAFFLAVSLIFYAILGGADFGAGIIEMTSSRGFRSKHKDLVTRAMGPVWEANHVWLILAIVIVFTGFPAVFRQLSISYHIPLTLLLLGITVRGCAFTFRHYDAIHDDRSQRLYTVLFVSSSAMTPVLLGMVAASAPAGIAPADHTAGWAAVYLWPWFNWYAFATGILTAVLFGYIAAVYLAGEANEGDYNDIVRKVWWFGGLSIIAGGLVFLAAEMHDISLFSRFIAHPVAISCVAGATAMFVPLVYFLERRSIWGARVTISVQVAAVVIGWLALSFPNIIVTDTHTLGIYNASAPDATLKQLLIALCVGSVLIFPALGYLFYVFKRKAP